MKLQAAATCLLSLITVASIADLALADRKVKKSGNRNRNRSRIEEEETTTTTTEDPLAKILPLVTFNCKGRHEGYYADVQFECEVFHYCNGQGMLFTFMCPPTSRFNQKNLICDYDRFGKKSCAKSLEYFHVNENIHPKDNNTVTTTSIPPTATTPTYGLRQSGISATKESPSTTEKPPAKRTRVTEVPTNEAYVTRDPREDDSLQDAPYEYEPYDYSLPKHYYDEYETSTEPYQDEEVAKPKTKKKKKKKRKEDGVVIGRSVESHTDVVLFAETSTEPIEILRETTTTTTEKPDTELYKEQANVSPARKQVLDYTDQGSEAEASEDDAVRETPDEYGQRKKTSKSEDVKEEVPSSTRRRDNRRDRKMDINMERADASTLTPVRSLFKRPRPKNKFNLAASRSATTTTTTEGPVSHTEPPHIPETASTSPAPLVEYTSAEDSSEEITTTAKPKLPRTRTRGERKPYASRLTGNPRRKKVRLTTTPAPPEYDYQAEVVEIQPTEPPRTRSRGRKKLKVKTETTVERPNVYYDDPYESSTQPHYPTTTTTERPHQSYSDDGRYDQPAAPESNKHYNYYTAQPSSENVGHVRVDDRGTGRVVKRIKQRKRPSATTLAPPPSSTYVGPLADPFDIPPPTHLFDHSTQPPFRPTSSPRNRATIRLNSNVYEEYERQPTTPAPRKKKVLKGHKVTIALAKHVLKPKKPISKPQKEFFFKPKPETNYGTRLEDDRYRDDEYRPRPQTPKKEIQYQGERYRESRYREPQQHQNQDYSPPKNHERPPERQPPPNNFQSNSFSPLLPARQQNNRPTEQQNNRPAEHQTNRPADQYGEYSPWLPVGVPKPANQIPNAYDSIYENAPIFTISEKPDGVYATPQQSLRDNYDDGYYQAPPVYNDQYEPNNQPEDSKPRPQNQYQESVPPPNQFHEIQTPSQYEENRQENRYQENGPPNNYRETVQPQQYQPQFSPKDPIQEVRPPKIQRPEQYGDPNGFRPNLEAQREFDKSRQERERNYQNARLREQRNYESSRQHAHQALQSQPHREEYRPAFNYQSRHEAYPQNPQALKDEYTPYSEGSQPQPQYNHEATYQPTQTQPDRSREIPLREEEIRAESEDSQSGRYEAPAIQYVTREIIRENQKPRYEHNVENQQRQPNRVEYDSDRQGSLKINQYEEEIAYPASQRERNVGDNANYPVYSDSQEVLTTRNPPNENHLRGHSESNNRETLHSAPSVYHSTIYPPVRHIKNEDSTLEPDVSDSITSSQYVDKEEPFSKKVKIPSHESDKDGTHYDDREQKPFMGSYTYEGPNFVNENKQIDKDSIYKNFDEHFSRKKFQSHDGSLDDSESNMNFDIDRSGKKRDTIFQDAPHHKNFFNADIDFDAAASHNGEIFYGNATDSQVRRRRQIVFADHIHSAVSPYMGSRPVNNPFGHHTRQGQIYMQDNARFSPTVNSVVNARPIPINQRLRRLPHQGIHGQPHRHLQHGNPQAHFHHPLQRQHPLHAQSHALLMNSPAPPAHILMGYPLTVPAIRVNHGPFAMPQHQHRFTPHHNRFTQPLVFEEPLPNMGGHHEYQQERPPVQYNEQISTELPQDRPATGHYENRQRPPVPANQVPYYGYGYNPYRPPGRENDGQGSGEQSSNPRDRQPSPDYDTREQQDYQENERRPSNGNSNSYERPRPDYESENNERDERPNRDERPQPDEGPDHDERPTRYESQEDSRPIEENPREEESGNRTETSTLGYPDNVHAHYLKQYNDSDPISNPFDEDFFKPPPYYNSAAPYTDSNSAPKENDTKSESDNKPSDYSPEYPVRPAPPSPPFSYYGPYDPSANGDQKNETEKAEKTERRPPFDYTIPPIPEFPVTFPPPSKYTSTTEDPNRSSSDEHRDSVTESEGELTNLQSPVTDSTDNSEPSEIQSTTERARSSSTVGFGGRLRPAANQVFPRPTYKPSRNGEASTTETPTTKAPFTYRRASTTTIAPYANEEHTQSSKKVFHATGGAMSEKKLRPKLFGTARVRTTTESDLAGGESQLEYAAQPPYSDYLVDHSYEKDNKNKYGQSTDFKSQAETNELTTPTSATKTTVFKHGFEFATTIPIGEPYTTASPAKWSEPLIESKPDGHYYDQEAGSSPWAIYKEIGSPNAKKFTPTWITDKPRKITIKDRIDLVTLSTIPANKIFNVSVKWSPKIEEEPLTTIPPTRTVFKIPSIKTELTTPLPSTVPSHLTSPHITKYTSHTKETPWRIRIEDLMPETKAQNVVDEIRPVYNSNAKFSTTEDPVSSSTTTRSSVWVSAKGPPVTTTTTESPTTTASDTITPLAVTTTEGPDTTLASLATVSPADTTASPTTTTEDPFPGLDLSHLSLVDNIVADSVVRVVAAHGSTGLLEKFDSKRLKIRAM